MRTAVVGTLAAVLVVTGALAWGAKVGAVLLAIVVGLAAAIVWEAQASKGRRRGLKGRRELTLGEIYESYYADSSISRDLVGQALEEISEELSVPLGKLRPEDRFDVELGPTPGWEYDDDVSDVMAHARRRLADSHASQDVSSVRTVDDYVRLVARSAQPTTP
jgi:predicted small integral membrane protein